MEDAIFIIKIVLIMKKLTTEEFIKKAKSVHGDKYDYSKVDYINKRTKVCIICPEHGEFWQRPGDHLSGNGCYHCGRKKCLGKKVTTESFIKDAMLIHGDRYDYSKVKYANSKTKVCIICPEHGEFWQEASRHLMGDNCPRCKNSSLETNTSQILELNGIKYISGCNKSVLPWLGKQHLDFYLPEYNVGIECQGGQHFRPINFFGGLNYYFEIRKRDIKKLKLCKEHNIKLLYYSEENYEDFLGEKLYKNTDELLNEIRHAK